MEFGVFFLEVIIFGSVRFLLKKNNYTDFFIKKTKTEPKPVQTDRFWFGLFFRTKTGSNQFGTVFSVWLGFFRSGFGSVRFFQFQAYKIETEPNRSSFSKF